MSITKLNNLSISAVTALQSGVGGKVLQVTQSSDATLYSLSIPDASTDVVGSIAYSITPISASSKIIIHYTMPQVRLVGTAAGIRIRLYRQIAGGGYSHVTGLSGTASSSKKNSLMGNYSGDGDAGQDGNRSLAYAGTIVDSPATTSAVDYKFYIGVGDGAYTVHINRTANDTDAAYTSRTRTHVTLMEVTI